MTEFSHHEACPNCNSKDNVGVWEDGHKYCFGCGWTSRQGNSLCLASMKPNNNNNNKESSGALILPSDYSTTLPSEVKDWLDQYDISEEEVYRYKLGWSESLGRLIFPVFENDNQLLLWQGRLFKGTGPRYLTKGKAKDVMALLGKPIEVGSGQEGTTVICCEDFVSAIKIGRHFTSWCLFGSVLSTEALIRASRTFSKLGIWLDKDKAEYAVKRYLAASIHFDVVWPIITEFDPKCYCDDEIVIFAQQ